MYFLCIFHCFKPFVYSSHLTVLKRMNKEEALKMASSVWWAHSEQTTTAAILTTDYPAAALHGALVCTGDCAKCRGSGESLTKLRGKTVSPLRKLCQED